MTDYILDASAVMALLRNEPGADRVEAILGRSVISAVNLSEVLAKLIDYGATWNEAVDAVSGLGLDVRSFNETLAYRAGELRLHTARSGLSLGDRACLALANRLSLPAVTSDRDWLKCGLDVKIEFIR